MPEQLLEEKLTGSVIAAFFEVYNTLGFGFLEHIYVMALERELRARGHEVSREIAVRVSYKGDHLATQRIDMLIDGKLIVETKSTYDLHGDAKRQLFNYLRGMNIGVGLLLHFGPKPKFYRQIFTGAEKRNGLARGTSCMRLEDQPSRTRDQ